MSLNKILIANRGEVAVRVARACADAGIGSVAVYSEEDRDAFHVRAADEAFSLGGSGASATYLNPDALLAAAQRSAADAVHPGYGFLAESAEFARAVTDAGLVWIGPSPEAIEALGDKTSARRIAARAGAPLIEGTADPVADVAEVEAFAAAHGFPLLIKAAFGGGGRGQRVVRSAEEIGEAFAAASREAVAAFGRGECFVERYLDRPRHIEAQCLADAFGAVAVLSTRDCSVQRRHQKLVEEAPAPFLAPEVEAEIDRASRAILKEVGYVGAATCEFLLDSAGTLAFLEVNTRLQVEHPVTEEVTGIDLVREQFRIADGQPLGYTEAPARGCAIEFRINGEDPAAGFLPSPGLITALRLPSGPGVRCDFGYEAGDSVSGAFDSLIGKVVVSGADRAQALARARRALRDLEVAGPRTVAPVHQAILAAGEFCADRDRDQSFSVHTCWLETEWQGLGDAADPAVDAAEAPAVERLAIEVSGKRFEVVLPAGLGRPAQSPMAQHRTRRTSRRAQIPAQAEGTVTAPMQGTIVQVPVCDGQTVEAGQVLVVLEAMKMEQPLTALRPGVVTDLAARVGDRVAAGAVLCALAD
ncbi:MAG: biotin/lipoyl-binding protein [Bifidobacteriaceae bacterium]|nr:biotin/lipoyl-binding protein [Bifidobacteriaceae bacterium]